MTLLGVNAWEINLRRRFCADVLETSAQLMRSMGTQMYLAIRADSDRIHRKITGGHYNAEYLGNLAAFELGLLQSRYNALLDMPDIEGEFRSGAYIIEHAPTRFNERNAQQVHKLVIDLLRTRNYLADIDRMRRLMTLDPAKPTFRGQTGRNWVPGKRYTWKA